MTEIRKTAKERESAGVRTLIGGVLLVGVGLFNQAPGLGVIGAVVAVIGLIMWVAGMARND